MRTERRRKGWQALLLALVASGCVIETAAPKGMPPIVSPEEARRGLIVGKNFRIVVLDFGAKESTDTGLERTLAAMVLTELKNDKRFAVYDGGIARRGDVLVNEENAKESADAYLTGTVTARHQDEVCLDLRLANAVSREVLFARWECAKLKAGEKEWPANTTERQKITRMAQDISRTIKKLEPAKVVSADGRMVVINKGSSDDVLRGMPAYIEDTGSSIGESAIDDVVRSLSGIKPEKSGLRAPPAIVGQLYILSVEDYRSIAILFDGERALPGDTVVFK